MKVISGKQAGRDRVGWRGIGGGGERRGFRNAEVSKIVWKRNGGVPRIFLNMPKIKGSASFHQSFETHSLVKRLIL